MSGPIRPPGLRPWAVLAITAALAGCANPYAYTPEPAVFRAPLPDVAPPEEPLPPVVFQPNPRPLPPAPPEPEYDVRPDPPPLAIEAPPPAPDAPTPAEQVPPTPIPTAAAPPGAEKGNVPLMGFRPMRGQKAPGA